MKNNGLRRSSNASMQPLFLLGIIAVMIAMQAILVPGSVTSSQLWLVSRQASALGIIALGQAAVILVGGIDLSVGSIVMITNVFCIALMRGSNQYVLGGLAVCLLIALVIGASNALGVLVLNHRSLCNDALHHDHPSGRVLCVHPGRAHRQRRARNQRAWHRLSWTHPLFHRHLAGAGAAYLDCAQVYHAGPQGIRRGRKRAGPRA